MSDGTTHTEWATAGAVPGTDGTAARALQLSDITHLNDGGVHVVSGGGGSVTDETLVVTGGTTVVLEAGGYVEAPPDTDWPALRLSISSTFLGKGGTVTGSRVGFVSPAADGDEGEGDVGDLMLTRGGDGIHLNNGQSGPDTGSRGEFDAGSAVRGGDSSEGPGGDALVVNGFGTVAVIRGGSFAGGRGGIGTGGGEGEGDEHLRGLSVSVLNGGAAHVHGGSFEGDMRARSGGTVILHGCFLPDGDGSTYRGTFAGGDDGDEVAIRTDASGGGAIVPVASSDLECESFPSSEPTNYPTSTRAPTVTRPSSGSPGRGGGGGGGGALLLLVAGVHSLRYLLRIR